MCSDTERMEMLIVLHICSFLLSYDSSDMSFGDIETTVSWNQSREICCDLSLGKFVFLLNYSFYSSYIEIHSQSLKVFLTANETFHKAFWYVKVTQPLLRFWVNLVFVNSPRWISISSPIGFLYTSPVEKELLDFKPENFWKFYIFPG